MREDLGEQLIVDLVQLFQSRRDDDLVLAGDAVHVLREMIGRCVNEHLRVFELLGIFREIHMDEVGVVLDAFQRGAGLFHVARGHLVPGDFGIDMNQFGVEKALFALTGVFGAVFQLRDGGGIERKVRGGGERACGGKGKGENDKGGADWIESHEAPAWASGLRSLHMFKSYEAVLRFELLVGKTAVRCCEKVFVSLLCELHVPELVL